MNNSAKKQRKENAIRDLQKMRRANNGMRGCAEILIQHAVNKEGVKTYPCANIILTVQQEAGLHYVIEACADMIDKLFYDIEDEHNIGWTEDHLHSIRPIPTILKARNGLLYICIRNSRARYLAAS